MANPLSAAERTAAVALLALLPVLLTPWVRITSEPMCILQDPCPPPETTARLGYEILPAVVLAATGLLGALALLFVRSPATRRLLAALPVLAAGAVVLATPVWPDLLIFARFGGFAWGGILGLAAATLALLSLAAAVVMGPEPTAAAA